MDRREFLLNVAKTSIITNTGILTQNLFAQQIGKIPISLNIQKISEKNTGNKHKLEFIVNSHLGLTNKEQGINKELNFMKSEIDYYVYQGQQDKNKKFYIEGISNRKSFTDLLNYKLGDKSGKIVIDDVLQKIPITVNLREIKTQIERYNYALNNLPILLNFLTTMMIAREILGYKNVDVKGIENQEAYEKMLELDLSIGLEDRVPNSYLDNMKKILFLESNANSMLKEDKIAIKKYIDSGLKDFDEYLRLHKVRGKAFVTNSIDNLLSSGSNFGIVGVGYKHLHEITTALNNQNKVDYIIYSPTNTNFKNQPIEQTYKELISELKRLSAVFK